MAPMVASITMRRTEGITKRESPMQQGKRLDRFTAREWAQILSCYREPNHARSVFELAITAGAFIVMWVVLRFGPRLTLLLPCPPQDFSYISS